MISETVKKQIIEAMKAKDELRKSTLKMLSSALHNAVIAKQDILTEEEELKIVQREAKKRNDAIEAMRLAQSKPTQNRPDLGDRIDKENSELNILKEFLPPELTDDDLEKLVSESISQTKAKDMKDIGKVIGMVMGKAKGRADGRKVADLVKSKLL
jgi:uncharacterized protein YqeY